MLERKSFDVLNVAGYYRRLLLCLESRLTHSAKTVCPPMRSGKRIGLWKGIGPDYPTRWSNCAVLAGLALVWVTAAWIYGSTGEPLLDESPVRLVVGSICIFLMPGLIWGEILGYRSRHVLESVALAFALTLGLDCLLLPVAFLLGNTMDFFVTAIFAITLAGLGLLALRITKGEMFRFISPSGHATLYGRIEGLVTLACLMVLSAATYRCGEELWDIAGEKMLQLIWIRHYFELPLDFGAAGFLPGETLPNVVNLWEFLVAATAKISGIDPAYTFNRIRFVLPFLGFSGIYLFIRSIFGTPKISRAVFWYVLLLCISGFAVLDPSTIQWVVGLDPTRGAFHFIGSVHHSDAAMAILLGLVSGLLLGAYRRPNARNMLLLVGVLLAGFLWHPREIFQTAVYWGIFLLLIVGSALRRGGNVTFVLKRWSLVMGAYVAVAVGYVVWSAVLRPELSHSHDEMSIKQAALKYALQPDSMLGFRSLFHIPNGLYLDNMIPGVVLSLEQALHHIDIQWNFSLWLILSALAIPVLALFGRRRERVLGLYYVLLWVLALCWTSSLLLIMALTYSEFFMTTPRLLYLFAFIVVATAVHTLSRVLSQRVGAVGGPLVYLPLMLIGGYLIHVATQANWPWERFFSGLVTAIVVLSIVYTYLKPAAPVQRVVGVGGVKRALPAPVCFAGGLLLLAPVLQDGYIHGIPRIFSEARAPVDWAGQQNPFGLSLTAVEQIRSLPAGSMVLTDPFDDLLLQAYAPVYTVAVPKKAGAPFRFWPLYQNIADGKNPVFRDALQSDDPSHQKVTEWLDSYSVGYVLARADHFGRLAPYFAAHTTDYEVLHESTRFREVLVAYRSKSNP